ncbi:MAG TPA: DUF2330 domain-containing protein, partial [Polyangiaceae bacterium]
PFMEPYVQQKMVFLAMRLLPDKDVTDIEPVKMTYTGQEPMIPLQLTAIAARPQMGVVVWILANQRFSSINYADIYIADEDIAFAIGSNNYRTVVAQKVHAAGHGFVTELAGPAGPIRDAIVSSPAGTADAMAGRDALATLLSAFPYITRLYTRISPEDMTLDPTFAPSTDQSDISNIHNLSMRISDAGTSCEAPVCAFTDCGNHGRCIEIVDADGGGQIVLNDSVDACLCDDGYTAVPLPVSFGAGAGVQCEPVTNDVLAAGADVVCANTQCGEGSACVAINGGATCACKQGTAANAIPAFDGTTYVSAVRCIDVGGPIPPPPTVTPPTITLGDAGAGSRDGGGSETAVRSGGGCNLASRPTPWSPALSVAALALLAMRRRRVFRCTRVRAEFRAPRASN